MLTFYWTPTKTICIIVILSGRVDNMKQKTWWQKIECKYSGFHHWDMSILEGGYCFLLISMLKGLWLYQTGQTFLPCDTLIYFIHFNNFCRYWKYLSDRSYMAPMAFDTSNPLYTVTVPAFFIGSTTIIILIGTFSVCHFLAYGKDEDKIFKNTA